MKLIIEDDEGRRTVVPIVQDEIGIGRNEANLVRLTEKNVSRKHARLVRDGERFYIEDLDSFTGVMVNGERIQGKRLIDEGDLIQISEYDLVLESAPGEARADEGARAEEDPTPVREREAQAAAADAQAEARKSAETAVIRLADLGQAADETPVDVPPAEQPRLVGLSGSWRGREIPLRKTPLRLGRSDENDVSIDHPSISRHHLRLHRDGTAWKVLDAESRNGVRVNGEPYAAIGLHHGDVLEVGHLRFAFCAPGQSVKLPAQSDAPAPRERAPASRTGLYAGAGALLAVAALGSFLLLRGRNQPVSGGGEDAKVERKDSLRAAEEASASRSYVEALRHLEAARLAGATAAELRNYPQIAAEARSEELYREMESAADAQDFDRARKLLGTLGASGGTWYGAKASDRADPIIAGYVKQHVSAGEAIRGKDNAACLAEAKLALQANPRSPEAAVLAEACKPAASARPSAAVQPARKQRPAPATERGTAAADTKAKELVDEGNAKLNANDVPAAIPLFQKALALKPSPGVLAGIYRGLGIAHTRQKDLKEGARYYRLYLPLCDDPAEKAELQKVLDEYDRRQRG